MLLPPRTTVRSENSSTPDMMLPDYASGLGKQIGVDLSCAGGDAVPAELGAGAQSPRLPHQPGRPRIRDDFGEGCRKIGDETLGIDGRARPVLQLLDRNQA